MRDFVVMDGETCVGKYRQQKKPSFDQYDVIAVDDLSQYTVEQWHYR
jgi:hypothetical protein